LSQRVFIVTGAKGGVGTTTFAIKLAQRFPALGERMIVDADLSGKRSLAVCFDLSDELDQARVIGSATVVTMKSGQLVMELARTYEDGLIQTAASVTRAIAGLSEHALVVVDAPQPFAATVRPFLARASKIILITEPTLMGVAGARAMLAVMDRAGVPATHIALAVCDMVGSGGLTRAEIERELAVPVSAELTNVRDRKFDALFDGFVTMLSTATRLDDPNSALEKPVFDRRIEPGEVMQ
jgi:MinD-like ATPase involved in chromosome partitioning or flagellar assembly